MYVYLLWIQVYSLWIEVNNKASATNCETRKILNMVENTYGAVFGNLTLSFINAVVEYSLVVRFMWIFIVIFSNMSIISSGVTYK